MNDPVNQRIARLYRDIMRCYAVRWKIIRLDDHERRRAAVLERAKYCWWQAHTYALL